MSKKPGWLDVGFIAHRGTLLNSVAWRSRSIPLVHILERLELEQLAHAGTSNGQLFVSFEQFVEYGISRKSIKPAIQLGTDLGLLSRTALAPARSHTIRPAQGYRLNYLPGLNAKAPTDEWARVSEVAAAKHVKTYKATMAKRNRS